MKTFLEVWLGSLAAGIAAWTLLCYSFDWYYHEHYKRRLVKRFTNEELHRLGLR